MRKFLFLFFLLAGLAFIGVAQIEYPVLNFPPIWEWRNPGPVSTETSIEMEILPQVGIETYREVDLGPICIMEDSEKSWVFPFGTKSNCNALVTLHWSFRDFEATCTNDNWIRDEVVGEVVKNLELEYLGFYEWNFDNSEWIGADGSAAHFNELDDLLNPWDPRDFDNRILGGFSLTQSLDMSFGLKSCFRKHFLKFTWTRSWEECEDNWCLTMPAGKYWFVVTYEIKPHCPEG